MYYYLYTLSGHEHYEYAYGYSRQSPLGPYTWPEQDIILTTDKEAKIYVLLQLPAPCRITK
ncbi:hypothetical protein PV783_15730 [Chitinophaga sp. CC14]|uniref:hypothetical protein n=1 Tax=Chitinophaga sp. CC14 TaxID=3029199 RepID=UPI003B82BD5E